VTDPQTFLLTTAREGEEALVAELALHGLTGTPTGIGGVELRGSLEDAYRALLWTRIASRVLLPLGIADATDGDTLYDSCRRAPWDQHLHPERTFAIYVSGGNRELRHPHFTALRVKDAIVDHFRDKTGERPSVQRKDPDVQLNVHVHEDDAHVSIDLSGGAPLHLRGRGRDGGPAPLRETLAAAILVMADWPTLCQQGVPLVDPFCGSGTFLREAAGYALDRAPGLHRQHWGHQGWLGHDAQAWERLLEEARDRAKDELPSPILGFDKDKEQVRRARANLTSYDLAHLIPVVRHPFDKISLPDTRQQTPRGLLVSNPPYGERLGEFGEVTQLWRSLGDDLRHRWLGWTAWLLAGSKELAGELGLRPKRRIPLRNGPLDARLIEVPIHTEAPRLDESSDRG